AALHRPHVAGVPRRRSRGRGGGVPRPGPPLRRPARGRRPVSAAARPLLLWSVAGALGGLGTGLLFDAAPGLNWGVWTLASPAAPLLGAPVGGAPRRAPVLVPLALAAAFGLAATVTADPPSHALIAGGVAALLALAVLLAGSAGWETVTAPLL